MRINRTLSKFTTRILGICLALYLTMSSTVCSEEACPKAVQLQIIEKASFFMPNSLRKILARNEQFLEKGLDSISIESFLSPEGRISLETKLLDKMVAIARTLHSKPNFSQMARDFGAVAHMILYLNLPEGKSLKKDDIYFILCYLLQHSSSFRIILYDASSTDNEVESLLNSIKEIRLRRADLSTRLSQAYSQKLREFSSGELNSRSVLFGLSSLVYSHSIDDLAKMWLWAWKSANGDMTGGTVIHDQK